MCTFLCLLEGETQWERTQQREEDQLVFLSLSLHPPTLPPKINTSKLRELGNWDNGTHSEPREKSVALISVDSKSKVVCRGFQDLETFMLIGV